ncbi:MAG: helix-turn-helix transcriptional regulator [Muribaculaceae bacterium]
MQIVNYDSKLCDLIVGDPSLIAVLNRFGITLGVGDKTIARVCDENGIDKTFLSTILNTYINEDYVPCNGSNHFNAAKIVNYLQQTNAYYEHYLIPNIERHFNFLMSKNKSSNSSLLIIYKFFVEVKEELMSRIKDDRENLFPQVLKCFADVDVRSNAETIITPDIVQEDSIESKISDLLNMFVMHISGEYDGNLAHAVLIALFGLKKDINQNNRIRERVLNPIVAAIDSSKYCQQ